MADCLKVIEDAAGGKLTDDELEEIFEELQAARQTRATENGLESIEASVMNRGRVIAEDVQLAAAIEKRNRYKNILVEQNLWSLMHRADEMTDSPSLGLEAALVGVNAPFEGAGRSVDGLTNGLMGEYAGGMIADLRGANLLTQFNNMKGTFEVEVARALSAMNTPDARMPKVSAEARQIADIMHKYQRASINRLNSEGGYVRRKTGYVIRQVHRADRMATVGQEQWKATIRPLLDFDKMGIAPERVDEFLTSVYEATESGVRINREVTDLQRAFKGPGNIAKKDAASRLLEFRSPEAWLEYDRQFGHGSLREGFMQDLSHNARNTALMINFGTNPQAMLDRVIDRAKREWRADPDKRKRLVEPRALQNMMDEVTGDVNLTANHKVANVMAGFRAVQTMAKLGGSAISALSDVAFNASNRIYQGRSIMDAWHDAFTAPFEGLSGGDKRIMADLMGAGLEGQLGDFMSRFNASDQIAGRTSKLMARYFKMNLLGPWTDASKRGVTMMISRDLAMNAGQTLDALAPDLQRLLRIYGIDDARKWDVARMAVQDGPDGRSYLMPGDIDDVRGAPFRGLSEAQQTKLRNEVKSSLFTMLSSEADFSVPSPGARERAILRQGYRPGTPAGEAIRFVGQFKSFSVVALTKVMGRHVYGHAGTKRMSDLLSRGIGQNLGIINAVAMSTAMGYFVVQAKEMMKGREPRPLNVKTATAALLQGGGAGIYGDFLFGEANRFGGGTLQTIAGPGIGTVAEVVDLLQRARGVVEEGEVDLRGDVLRLVKGNTPFINLFYTRAALDYLLFYHMQEAINPGYLRRMERRIERENDQQFWLPPSSVIQTGGGFR